MGSNRSKNMAFLNFFWKFRFFQKWKKISKFPPYKFFLQAYWLYSQNIYAVFWKMPEEIDFENGPKSSKKSLKSANFEEKSWKKILLDFFFGIHIPLMEYHFDIVITVENRSWGGGVPLNEFGNFEHLQNIFLISRIKNI